MREERYKAILELLEKQEFVTVEELCQKVTASVATIRRDLSTLADRKSLIRSRGGAMRISASQTSIPLTYRRVSQISAKMAIARRAAAFVKENSVIFIDSSATANYIINHLKNLNNVIIVTNSLEVATMTKNINAKTYCLCGSINGNTASVGGYLAVESAGFFNIDTFFFSAYGLDPKGNMVEAYDDEVELKELLLNNARCSIFLCDRSKFDKTEAYVLGSLSKVDYVITDGPLPEHCPKPKQEVIVVE